MAQIKELKEIMEDAFEDLISTYIQDSQDKLEQLSKANLDQDEDMVASLGHSLKGSSLNICAEDLSNIFRQIEDSARSNDLSTITQLLVQVNAEFEAVKIALNGL
jgi:HPt (histidine-containing phosphotransfer) domain-containing protein